jgi:hypothetical protein
VGRVKEESRAVLGEDCGMSQRVSGSIGERGELRKSPVYRMVTAEERL